MEKVKEEIQQEQPQINGMLYEQEKIKNVLNALNTIPVSGMNQINAMSMIFEVLTKPIPFKAAPNEAKTAQILT